MFLVEERTDLQKSALGQRKRFYSRQTHPGLHLEQPLDRPVFISI